MAFRPFGAEGEAMCHNYSLSAWVLENQPPGTFVLQVRAHDADIGLNGQVKYGIMHRDGASSGFTIDPDTGVISTTVSFDRERQREFTLSVTATDLAQEPLIGICQITVFVADQNDNDPKFENSRYQCESTVRPPSLRPALLSAPGSRAAALPCSSTGHRPFMSPRDPPVPFSL
ncbi:neural-cadherin-like [Arapaima gigas]